MSGYSPRPDERDTALWTELLRRAPELVGSDEPLVWQAAFSRLAGEQRVGGDDAWQDFLNQRMGTERPAVIRGSEAACRLAQAYADASTTQAASRWWEAVAQMFGSLCHVVSDADGPVQEGVNWYRDEVAKLIEPLPALESELSDRKPTWWSEVW